MAFNYSATYKNNEKFTIPLRIWLIWIASASFYSYQFILRVSPSVITSDLMQAFSVQACALGILSACYHVAYALMQVPGGILIDKFGPRRLLTAGLLLCVTGVIVMVSAAEVKMAAGGRFLMGLGSAFAYIGTLKIITLWFPSHYIGRIIGFTMVFGTLGGVMGGAPLSFLVDHLEWRHALLLLGVVGIGLATVAWLLIRDKLSDLGYQAPPSTNPPSRGFWKDFIKLLSSPQVWLIGIYANLMYVPLASFAALWGVPYIVELYKVDRKIAASVISMILIGVAIGSPLTTYLSDRLQNRKKFMTYSALGSAIIYALIIYSSHISLTWMYILLFLGGLFFTGQVLSFAAITESMPLSISGMALGLTNMIVMVSGVIFEPLVGWLLEISWRKTGGTFINNIPHYSVENFRFALFSIPLSLLGAVILTRFIKETYPKSEG